MRIPLILNLPKVLHKDCRHVKKMDCRLRPEQYTDAIVRAAVEPAYQNLREHLRRF